MNKDSAKSRRVFLYDLAIDSGGLLTNHALKGQSLDAATTHISHSSKNKGKSNLLSNKISGILGILNHFRDIKEWIRYFQAIKALEINIDMLIRGYLGICIASPFDSILKTEDVNYDPVDPVGIFSTLTDAYKMRCRTIIESFDRAMPIRFLPNKGEMLLLKLEAARKTRMENAVNFEFSHFTCPNPTHLQAENLYERYREHFD